MSAPQVPFVEVITPGERGGHCEAWGRALWRAGHLYHEPNSDFSDVHGPAKTKATCAFQRRKGLKVTGVVDQATWDAMERTHAKKKPTEWAFDPRAISLATAYAKQHPPLTPDEKARKRMAAWWAWAIQQRDRIGYSQSRPYQRIDEDTLPTQADCSSMFTMGYKAAGAPDPNGRGFDGLGYTGTLLDHGRPVSRGGLRVGDAAFYGFTTSSRPGFPYGSPTHVAGVIRVVGSAVWVMSHGSRSGPLLLPLDYRSLNSRTPFRTFDVT